MNRIQTAILSSLTAVLVPATAAAQVAIMPVQGINLEPGEMDAVGVVLAQAYAEEAGGQVLAPAQTAAALAGAGSASAAAAQLGAKEYIETTAIRLATKITIQTVRRAADGGALFRAEMTANSLDDIEQVAERLAQSLHRQLSVDEVRGIKNVTQTEAKARNRLFVEKVMGLKASYTQLVAQAERFEPALSLQFDGRLEAEKYFLEFGAGFQIATDTRDEDPGVSGLFAEMGGSYYLTDGNIAPYIGVGALLQLRFGTDVTSYIGLAPYLQGGVMFLRESSSRFFIDLRCAQDVIALVRETGGYDWVTATDTPIVVTRYYPTELSVLFGIGW